MKSPIVCLLFLILISAFNSCKKEGPQGPQGEQGVQGPPGSVNIIVKKFSIDSVDWSLYGTLGTDAYYETALSIPDISQAIVDNGTVLLYYQGTGDSWWSVPQIFFQTGYQYQFTFGYANGELIIDRFDNDFNPVNPGLVTFKLVIIPGSAKKEWDVDLRDYAAVKKFFHIKD
jgi:hypothetical protein